MFQVFLTDYRGRRYLMGQSTQWSKAKRIAATVADGADNDETVSIERAGSAVPEYIMPPVCE